jgi:hypothetical protein
MRPLLEEEKTKFWTTKHVFIVSDNNYEDTYEMRLKTGVLKVKKLRCPNTFGTEHTARHLMAPIDKKTRDKVVFTVCECGFKLAKSTYVNRFKDKIVDEIIYEEIKSDASWVWKK